MSVTVYHGSPTLWKHPRVDRELSKSASLMNEGEGLYCSLDRFVAEFYGGYLYTLTLKSLTDYRAYSEVYTLVTTFGAELHNLLRQSLSGVSDGKDVIAFVDTMVRNVAENAIPMLVNGELRFNVGYREFYTLVINQQTWCTLYYKYDILLDRLMCQAWSKVLAPAYLFWSDISNELIVRRLSVIKNCTLEQVGT